MRFLIAGLLLCVAIPVEAQIPLRQSTQRVVRVGPFLDITDGATPETGITLGAADQAEALKAAGAATVDISAATFAAVTGCDGYYDLTLTASHTDTVGDLTIVIQDVSVCFPVKATFVVIEEAVYDRDYAAAATGEVSIADGAITADTFSAGLLFDNAVDEVIVGSISNDAITAAATAADFGTEIGTAVWATTTRQLTATQSFNLTGDITGNLSGSVGSVTGAVGSVTGLTNATVADAVWDELAAGHNIAGSLSEVVQQNGLMIGDLQTWWDPNGGVLSNDLDAVLADTNELQTDWANGGRLDLILDDIPQQVFDGQPDGPVVLGSLFQLVNDAHDHAEQLLVDVAALPAPLDAAGTRAAIGLAAADLDTQLDGLSTGIAAIDIPSPSDVEQQSVPPSRTWTLVEGPNGWKGELLKSTIDGSAPLYAIDFRNALSTNQRIVTFDSIVIADGTAGGVTFGTLKRDRSQAKVKITAVTPDTYTLRVTVTDNDNNIHVADVQLKVTE